MDFRRIVSLQVRQSWRRLKDSLTKYCQTCQTCKNLSFIGHGLVRVLYLKESASSGCRYCIFLFNALKHFNLTYDDYDNYSIRFLDGYLWAPAPQSELQLDLYTPTGHPPAWHGVAQDANPLDAVLSGSPRTSEAYEFIRSCLRDCDANHPECKIAGQELPTRLLDVQHEGAQQVILVETESLPVGHSTTYIALSYCWGKEQSLTLRSENLEVMKLGLMVSSLPQTLQDAIAVTRTLGQQYLWVDALCIIQNSPSDWEVESSRMASVYRDAYLTIAAATASDVTQGFLSRNYRETNTWYKEPYHQQWTNQEACSTILGVRLKTDVFGHEDEDNQALVLPWSLRGWTLQEQFLSRRLLKYHAYELRWVCQKKSACQCGSNSKTALDDSPTYRLESAKLAHEQWRRIVFDYTARELTDARDKLPAISGRAQVFQQVIQSPYIAGMWENQLPLDLLWVASGSQVRCAPELYVAPTFCWASISSLVVFSKTEFWPKKWVSQTVVEDTCSIVDGKDPMGRVKDGWIKLRGYIFKAALADHPESRQEYRYWVSTKDLEKAHLKCDTWLEEFEATNEHGDVERSVRRMRQPSVITPHDNEPSPSRIKHGTVVYLFLIASSTLDVNLWFYFLVLGLSSDKPGMYARSCPTLFLFQIPEEEGKIPFRSHLCSRRPQGDYHSLILGLG